MANSKISRSSSSSSSPAARTPKGEESQRELPLFEGFFSADKNESRTFEIFDALPKYVYAKIRQTKNLMPITRTILLRRRGEHGETEELQIEVTLAAAVIKGQDGTGQAIYPGAREELVERAIRKLAVQQVVNTGLHTAPQSGVRIIRVSFTLYQLRNELTAQGHGFKIVELKEALEVLNKAVVNLSCARDRTLHGLSSAVFSNYTYEYQEDDDSGRGSKVSVDYHPLATHAIINLAFYPINYHRVMSLASPLARWLVTRMSHRFRQATKAAFFDGASYQISLTTILNESGIANASRLRDNVAAVRQALGQMTKENVLHAMRPYEESLTYASTKGRKKVVDVVWQLFPSRQFAREIIEGNVQMNQWRRQQQESMNGRDLLNCQAILLPPNEG
jgi:hypothetical protein